MSLSWSFQDHVIMAESIEIRYAFAIPARFFFQRFLFQRFLFQRFLFQRFFFQRFFFLRFFPAKKQATANETTTTTSTTTSTTTKKIPRILGELLMSLSGFRGILPRFPGGSCKNPWKPFKITDNPPNRWGGQRTSTTCRPGQRRSEPAARGGTSPQQGNQGTRARGFSPILSRFSPILNHQPY